MVNNLPLLIDGEFVESNSKDYLEVTNPLSQGTNLTIKLR